MSVLLALLAQAGLGTAHAAPPFETSAVPDRNLATQRGGLRLPNGIDLALAVQTQTALNGAVVLQTVYAVDQGPAMLTVYAPANGSVVPAQNSGQPSVSAAPMAPIVSYDPRTGLSVMQGYSGMPVTVGGANVQSGPASVPQGLVVVDQASSQQTAAGAVSSQSDGLLRTVTLTGSDFSVAHLAGTAFGSAVANSGSDRAIDTITNISIDLKNAGPDVLGSVFFRVEDVALGALGSRM